MCPQSTVDAGDLYIGSGKIYLDRLDANRARTGERFIGNATLFALGITDDVKEKYSSADAQRGLLKQAVVKRTPELKIEFDELNVDNAAQLFMGTVNSFAQTGAAASNYVPPTARVRKGYSFPVEDPIGTPRRSISAVNVTGPASSPTYVAGTDFVADLVSGMIYIVPTGAIADGAALEVDFTYATITGTALPFVKAGVQNFIECFVRFKGDPTAGPTEEIEIWIASLAPDGESNFISEDFSAFKLKGKVLADTVNHPTEQFFRIYTIAT